MDQKLTGLSQEQQNEFRAALQRFIDKHEISDWGATIEVDEVSLGKFSVKIEITAPAETGLQGWTIKETAETDETSNIAAEIEKMLELAYQERFAVSKMR